MVNDILKGLLRFSIGLAILVTFFIYWLNIIPASGVVSLLTILGIIGLYS